MMKLTLKKWFYCCYQRKIYYASCLDFISIEPSTSLKFDLLFLFDEFCEYCKNYFIDDADCDYSNCMVSAIDSEYYPQNSAFQKFCERCREISFHQHFHILPNKN